MPIKLKNRDLIRNPNPETIHVLGLDIPTEGDLPFGAQVELMDLNQRREDGLVGGAEFILRVFCLMTTRLPKRDQVKYEWLAEQHLEAGEMTELMEGVNALLLAPAQKRILDEDAGDEGNAPTPKKRASSTRSK